MRERAETIGGHFEIQSRVGLGTQVIVRLPRPKLQ
jgi:signal transduction histidine kinase